MGSTSTTKFSSWLPQTGKVRKIPGRPNELSVRPQTSIQIDGRSKLKSLSAKVDLLTGSASNYDLFTEEPEKELNEAQNNIDDILNKGRAVNNVFKPTKYLGKGGYGVVYLGKK